MGPRFSVPLSLAFSGHAVVLTNPASLYPQPAFLTDDSFPASSVDLSSLTLPSISLLEASKKVVGYIKNQKQCLRAQCWHPRKKPAWDNLPRKQGRASPAICPGECVKDENKNENIFSYDFWSKRIKVTMKDDTVLCLTMDPQGVLIAQKCDDEKIPPEQAFDYQRATKQFMQAGRCLEMSYKYIRPSTTKDDEPKPQGGRLNGCDEEDVRQQFDLPDGTFLGDDMENKKKKADRDRDCKAPLGLTQPGTFKLKASSEKTDATAEMGRLFLKGNGWCAKTTAVGEWLEVNFGSMTTVVALAVQAGDSDPSQYVQSLTVKYKPSAKDEWQDYMVSTEFDVDTQGVGGKVTKVTFSDKLKAFGVRLAPTKWVQGICMRVELYGCASTEGDMGEKGNTGKKGDTGPPGPPGDKGETGEPADDGDSGDKGPVGPSGLSGLPGPRGSDGPPGLDGVVGAPGPIGPAGYDGPVGMQGDKGFPGPSGPQGAKVKGKDGLSGRKGPPGITGPVGPDGPPGKPGKEGKAGVAGAKGSQGPKGAVGVPGAQGRQGPRGPPGPNGLNGRPGPTGPKGDKGDSSADNPLEELLKGRLVRVRVDVQELSNGIDELIIQTSEATGRTANQIALNDVVTVEDPCPRAPPCTKCCY